MLEDRTSVARLYSRPVIQLSNGDLFVPRHAPGMARVVFIQRVLEGTWPEQLMHTDTRIEATLERRRSRVRPVHGFESHLAAVLAATGLRYAFNVEQSGPTRTSNVLGVCVRAEIGAVVVPADARTIWVVEAKDLAMPIAPRRIRSELDKYFRRRGHVDKLAEKIKDIEADPREVARKLGGPVQANLPKLEVSSSLASHPRPGSTTSKCMRASLSMVCPAFLGR